MMTAVHMKQIRAIQKSLGVKSDIDNTFQFGTTVICPVLPEFDFMQSSPKRCACAGLSYFPLSLWKKATRGWLDKGPTVMINLGSHEKTAREIAGAIRIVLGRHDAKGASKMQVLWKVKASGDIEKVIDGMIGKEIKEGWVKVLAWLDAGPVSILQHPNVVCTVHHGGANSFYEGVWSGTPQIILSVWLDTYQYASRVEFLNIGVFGNKCYAPGVEAEEFGKALVRVTGDSQEAVTFRTTANRLKEVCRAKGNGRELACRAWLF